MHYRGTLAADGKEFDASYNRGQPLDFHVGKGQVIKGWDQGLLDMCPGDKRTLTIQPEFGYGSRGMGPIPANSVLGAYIFSSTGCLLEIMVTDGDSLRNRVGRYQWRQGRVVKNGSCLGIMTRKEKR